MVSSAGGHGFDAHLRGPSIIVEPPSRVEFSNSSGAWLDCTASGSPPPNIDWSTADGLPAGDVPGVRRVLRNGTLVLLPFPPPAFRQDVHSAAYRCVASNSVGRVLSRDVQVRAGQSRLYCNEIVLRRIRRAIFESLDCKTHPIANTLRKHIFQGGCTICGHFEHFRVIYLRVNLK